MTKKETTTTAITFYFLQTYKKYICYTLLCLFNKNSDVNKIKCVYFYLSVCNVDTFLDCFINLVLLQFHMNCSAKSVEI